MGLFRKGKACIIDTFHITDLLVCSHARQGKTLSHSQIQKVPVTDLGPVVQK